MTRIGLVIAALAGALLALPAGAAEHQVKLLNKGADGSFVFEPALLRIARGDTVKFLATDKHHIAGSLKGMVPAGAKEFLGKRSEDLTVTFDVPGLYAYDCYVHRTLGMVGLIVVGGDVSNLAAIKKIDLKGKAKERFDAMLAALERR